MELSSTRKNTTDFCWHLGTSDSSVANDILIAFGGDEARLQEVKQLLEWGCYRSAETLADALVARYGLRSKASRRAVEAIAAKRSYTEVPTLAAAERLLNKPPDTDDNEALSILGDTVPEWFFPALATIARDYADQASPEDKFLDAAQAYIEFWGIRPISEQTVEFACFLAKYFATFKKAEVTNWLIGDMP